MKVAVLLSGCGVYDGAEIHESVLSLLAIKQKKIDYICVAPDINQHHIINHTSGEEMDGVRNILIESSRISRGDIISLSKLDKNNISALVIPGGFGSAKNLSDWAFNGLNSSVIKEAKDLILHCVKNKKPIVSLCISPILIVKTLEDTDYKPKITIGTTKEKSPYEIGEIQGLLKSIGSVITEKSISEICIDEDLKIISAPCYMMEAGIDDVYLNIQKAINHLTNWLK